jgi:hypothetical protein
MHGWKLVDIPGTRKWNIWKAELKTLNQTVGLRTSETFIGAYINLRRVNDIELGW